MRAILLLTLWLTACGELLAPDDILSCLDCVPLCAVPAPSRLSEMRADGGVDYDRLGREMGCDPDLVVGTGPHAGRPVAAGRPEIFVELSRPLAGLQAGRAGLDCDGPIRLYHVGALGTVPSSVAVDITSRASLTSIPQWPSSPECLEGNFRLDGRRLVFEPEVPLLPFHWYEVRVPAALPVSGAGLCSALSWRFPTDGCGDGVLQQATSFSDWGCLGSVAATEYYFEPYSEDCDDGNNESGDACSAFCVHESGWTCDDRGCRTRCGDGIRTADEACDLGKKVRPGCTADCEVEPGWKCDAYGCWAL